MQSHDISVVVPVQNGQRHIGDCLRSILRSSGVNPEVIVVDGASTDGTLDVVAQLGDAVAQVISEPDEGQSDAIRKGFERARAPLVTWLCADDVVLPGAYARGAEILNENDRCGVVYGDVLLCDAALRPLKIACFPPALTLDYLLGYHSVSQPGALYRAAAIREAGGIDASLHYVMDFEMYIRILQAGWSAQHTGNIAAHFRLAGDSKTATQASAFVTEAATVLSRFGRRGRPGVIRARKIRLKQGAVDQLRGSRIARFVWRLSAWWMPAMFSDTARGRVLGLCVGRHFGGLQCGPHVTLEHPELIVLGHGAQVRRGARLAGPTTIPAEIGETA